MTDVNESTINAIHVIVKAYQKQIKNSIEEVLKTKIPNIDDQEFTGILKHEGAGGITYILQVNFFAGNRKITGGLVVKFANDLEEESRNATELSQILKKRQIWWKSNPPERPLPIHKFPVFSPKVLGTHPSRNVLILEFIGGGIPLLKTDFSEEKKYQILGYALARLHGSEAYETAMVLYEPMFKLLESFMPDQKEVIDFWKNILEQSKGGCKFIHGDSHLENLLFSETSQGLAWIDALLVPRGDRMDDVAYTISHIVQEQIIELLETNPNESTRVILSTVLKNVAKAIVPHILSTYMKTANLKGLYKGVIPIDFFLGFHLINRKHSIFGDSNIGNILDTMGREFIISRPLGQLLGLEKS